ncbi:uncharacterized protein [Scyliorhinus torazame]|uniref:uncharacterized protein isoform X1 n=1 Tax=Scyliorhinus torazame TaxID=75743 RepID=UPI003B5ABB6C
MPLAFRGLLVFVLLLGGTNCCMNCDGRLWAKFLEMMKRCLLVTTEQECSSQLDPVLRYTKDFEMVYTDGMIQSFLKLMDLIYPFMFILDYEPLDMVHAFLQVKLKAAVCSQECHSEYPVQVLYCSNCSIKSVSCSWPMICQESEMQQRKRYRRAIEGSDPQLAEKWRVAEMIMFPMIAILLIGLVAVLIVILLWLKQTRENTARCNVGFRYLKDEKVVPTYR